MMFSMILIIIALISMPLHGQDSTRYSSKDFPRHGDAYTVADGVKLQHSNGGIMPGITVSGVGYVEVMRIQVKGETWSGADKPIIVAMNDSITIPYHSEYEWYDFEINTDQEFTVEFVNPQLNGPLNNNAYLGDIIFYHTFTSEPDEPTAEVDTIKGDYNQALTLSWDPNSEIDLAGYSFAFAHPDSDVVANDIGDVNEIDIFDPIEGLYTFYVAAYDYAGNISVFGTATYFIIREDNEPPVEPSNIKVQFSNKRITIIETP